MTKKKRHYKKNLNPEHARRLDKMKKFERREQPPPLRKRGLFEVLEPKGVERIPHCEHGPCLLFTRRDESTATSFFPGERFFACAVFRHDECHFRATVDAGGVVTVEEGEGRTPEVPPENSQKRLVYNAVPKSLKKMKGDSDVKRLVFCTDCLDVFPNRHAHPARYVTSEDIVQPSQLLAAIDEQYGQAQYWFSEESLRVLTETANNVRADGVLCLGTPRAFEHFRESFSAFLLDYDRRYCAFYKSTEFAAYSMLVHHFYDPRSRAKLKKFLRQCQRVLLVCDPPFGVFLSPLIKNIAKIQRLHQIARKGEPSTFYTLLVLPLFVSKHVQRADPTLWMSDFRVTYANHKVFARPGKSIVRLFTNVDTGAIDLSEREGYRFCPICERWVAQENKHCQLCSTCPSKDGSTYRHCGRCKRCVKPTYQHCADCAICHLPERCTGGKALESGNVRPKKNGISKRKKTRDIKGKKSMKKKKVQKKYEGAKLSE